MIRIALVVLALAFARNAFAAAPEMLDGGNRLGQVRYFHPTPGHAVEGAVALISDLPGWDAAADMLATHLADEGYAVLGVDLKAYAAVIAKDKGDCTSVNTEFEVISRKIEKGLPFRDFHPPVVMGLGAAGAGVAYAVVGQAFPNTFEGGIGLGFTPVFDVGRKLCLPTAAGQPVRYGPVTNRETPWLFTPAPDFALADVKMFVTVMTEAHVIEGAADQVAATDEALRQIPELNAFVTPPSGLPIVALAPKGAPIGANPLVIFYSGDGGWRDIDKQIGGYLSDHGFFVIGFDSLRYFWREKQPKEMAADLDVLIHRYAEQAKAGIVLVGYSFGADLLPFVVNRMAPDIRRKVKLISLLGVSERASFEIRLDGILGAKNNDGPQTLPELLKIKNIPIQCVFGSEETDSICNVHELDSIVDRVPMGGGHHFGGDYHVIADAIIAAIKAHTSK